LSGLNPFDGARLEVSIGAQRERRKRVPAYNNTQSCSVELTLTQEFSVGVPGGPINRRIFNGGHAFAMPDFDTPRESPELLLCRGREIDNNYIAALGEVAFVPIV
jgi:hypothetical protein